MCERMRKFDVRMSPENFEPSYAVPGRVRAAWPEEFTLVSMLLARRAGMEFLQITHPEPITGYGAAAPIWASTLLIVSDIWQMSDTPHAPVSTWNTWESHRNRLYGNVCATVGVILYGSVTSERAGSNSTLEIHYKNLAIWHARMLLDSYRVDCLNLSYECTKCVYLVFFLHPTNPNTPE